MPVYEYECGACHCRFEKKQGFNDKPSALCPECRGKARRVLTPSAVIFKGSGFYVTDSRKGTDTSSLPTPPAPAPAPKEQPKTK